MTGIDPGDNECMYTGFNNDVNRCSFALPQQDKAGVQLTSIWGSAHSGGLNMVFGDGSVRFINYNIDLPTHQAQGDRN